MIVAVAVGGAGGALLRYWMASWLYGWLGRGFPIGTLAVNVLGSLAMGYLWIVMAARLEPNSPLRAGIMIGFLGAFTTFSTFSLETVALMQSGDLGKAALNILSSVVLCVAACALGMVLARAL
ncbi:MAG: fluoride efflux transporter CrcB [Gammaproteobacteria bacterium]|nr:fluoride efflux transporter CrcB [Gammaproteobacteria bacterium]